MGMEGAIPWRICQSCAAPLIRTEDLGTNADGSRSTEYCSRCYQQGTFVHPEMTLHQMLDLVIDEMTDHHHMPRTSAEAIACSVIPDLKRWNTTQET